MLDALSWDLTKGDGNWNDANKYYDSTTSGVATAPPGAGDDVTFGTGAARISKTLVNLVSGSVGSVLVTKPNYAAQLNTSGNFSTVAAGATSGTLAVTAGTLRFPSGQHADHPRRS
jgi:hypothetical protein